MKTKKKKESLRTLIWGMKIFGGNAAGIVGEIHPPSHFFYFFTPIPVHMSSLSDFKNRRAFCIIINFSELPGSRGGHSAI